MWPLTLALTLIPGSAAPARAAPGWTGPFQIAAPVTLDLVPAQIAVSAGDAAAVGYATQNSDETGSGQAFLTQSRGRGTFGPSRPVAGAPQTLALAYRGRDLVLLTGAAEPGRSCCSAVLAVGPVRRGSLGPPHALLSGLAGPTVARLLATPERLLAVIATERGVWAARSAANSDRFEAPHRLSGTRQLPQGIDAVTLAGGRSAIAWTARTDGITAPGPRTLYLAQGSRLRGLGRGRALLTVAPGREIDELALARGAGHPTAAWVESWYDRYGDYHSQVRASDLGAKLRPRTISSGRELAAGIAFAGAESGQVLSWKGCTNTGACSVRVVLRRAGGRLGEVQRAGPIDPSQTPAVTLTGRAHAVAGWVRGGHVLAAVAQGTRLARPRVVAGTSPASDLALAGAPSNDALAVWTQGTFAQSLVGSWLRGL